MLSFTFNHLLKQWLTQKKEGKTKIQKLEYPENEKSFLDKIKNIFHNTEDLSLQCMYWL